MPRIRHNDTGELPLTLCKRKWCHHTRGRHTGDGACTASVYDPFSGAPSLCKCTLFVPKTTPKAPRPVGTIAMRIRWNGEAPRAGDYLRNMGRSRYAYRVIDLDVGPIETAFTCERLGAEDVPAGSTVHAIRWDPKVPMEGTGWS